MAPLVDEQSEHVDGDESGRAECDEHPEGGGRGGFSDANLALPRDERDRVGSRHDRPLMSHDEAGPDVVMRPSATGTIVTVPVARSRLSASMTASM